MSKAAFVFTGEGDGCLGLGRDLYEMEPVVREVLDRCNQTFVKERGISLLDVILEKGEDLGDPALMQGAVYALECALAALWRSLGVNPGALLGDGPGLISAAQAAGVVGLEEGLRLAASVSEQQRGSANGTPSESLARTFAGIELVPPEVTLLNGATGRALRPGEAPNGDFWVFGEQEARGADQLC